MSYLVDRRQFFNLFGVSSKSFKVTSGVPQDTGHVYKPVITSQQAAKSGSIIVV